MKKILIVDDREEMHRLLNSGLSDEGFELIRVNGVREAAKKAKTERPSLIVIDLVKSEKSGQAFCTELTRNPATAGIPLILITEFNNPADIEAGDRSGVFDYIKRPFDKAELLARVRAALRYKEIQSLYTEFEKANIFSATVVTTNHKIKQPLTLINLCSTAIKREVGKARPDKEYIEKKIGQIETAVKDITDILNRLGEIEHPRFADYLQDIKMVDIAGEKSRSEEGE